MQGDFRAAFDSNKYISPMLWEEQFTEIKLIYRLFSSSSVKKWGRTKQDPGQLQQSHLDWCGIGLSGWIIESTLRTVSCNGCVEAARIGELALGQDSHLAPRRGWELSRKQQNEAAQ
jgi:hypothetical protein